MGIPVEYSFHEDSPSQHEIDLRYTDALSMADNVMTFRLVVREIAHGARRLRHVHAQAARGRAGLGHAHAPLALRGRRQRLPRRRATRTACRRSAAGFIAGLLHHAPEITAVTNQLVNSYKRLIVGSEAPAHVSWARNNRSALVRVPVTKAGKESSVRIEYRAPDPACNPYLAFSRDPRRRPQGHRRGLRAAARGHRQRVRAHRRGAGGRGHGELPQSLADALDVMEGSELVAEALGEHIFEWFLRNKRAEWADYKAQVTQFELDRYLPTW